MAQPADLYPEFSVVHPQNPNRLYAVPLLGIIIKAIICIPQFIILFFVIIAWFFVIFIVNPFVVLFTGKYWSVAHSFAQGFFRFNTKILLFIFGLSDVYPGFNFDATKDFILTIPEPQNPNRLFAIPLAGGFVRYVLLIPFFIYQTVIEYAAGIGAIFGASFMVLFMGKYPESVFELTRDYVRLVLSFSMYMSGLRDDYPSFWISMTHKNIKIALISLAVLYILFSNMLSMVASMATGRYNAQKSYNNGAQYQYNIENNPPSTQTDTNSTY